MNRVAFRLLAATLVLVASLAGLTAATPVPATEEIDSSALREAMSAPRIRDHLVALQNIARAGGGSRAMGTPGYQGSVDYVRDRLTAAGYRVTLQPFAVPYFDEVAPPVLTRIQPTHRTYAAESEVRTMSFSGAGEVTAGVQPVDLMLPPGPDASSTSGCEQADFTGFSRGAVALLQRGGCPFAVKAANAQGAGASAVLIMNEGQPGRRDTIAGSLEQPGTTVPVLGLSYDAGAELAAAPDSPVRVVTRVLSEQRETVNVIADSAGGRADRVVVAGAHLDSVPEGPGINDDGSGVAVLLELADQLALSPVAPRNRVRFAFWGAEELGLIGSTHYVTTLDPARLADIAVYLNFDMVGSPNFARMVLDGDGSEPGSTAGPPGSGAVERMFTEYFAAQGLPSEPAEFSGRSDYGPFVDAGVPAGGLFTGAEEVKTPEQAARYGGTAGQPLDPCYHQACDTLDNVSDTALEQFGDAAADVVLRMMLSPVSPRELR
ncbi:MAG: M28 family metallopeptidase [Pseudonocardia sp.]